MRNALRLLAGLGLIGAVGVLFMGIGSMMALSVASLSVVLLAAQETADTADFVEENLDRVALLADTRPRT